MTQPSDRAGHALFLTGIPSAGKSTVARIIQSRTPAFEILSGDHAVRRMSPAHRRLAEAHDLFLQLLDLVDDTMASRSVLVDMTLPGSYVAEARDRFGPAAFIVSLRVEEDDRRLRESRREDRSPVIWNESLTALQGSDDLYDMVVSSSAMTPEQCADAIVARAAAYWGVARQLDGTTCGGFRQLDGTT